MRYDMTGKIRAKKHVAFVDFYHVGAETSSVTLAILLVERVRVEFTEWTSIMVYGAYVCAVRCAGTFDNKRFEMHVLCFLVCLLNDEMHLLCSAISVVCACAYVQDNTKMYDCIYKFVQSALVKNR